jgi:hypothetical protein
MIKILCLVCRCMFFKILYINIQCYSRSIMDLVSELCALMLCVRGIHSILMLVLICIEEKGDACSKYRYY